MLLGPGDFWRYIIFARDSGTHARLLELRFFELFQQGQLGGCLPNKMRLGVIPCVGLVQCTFSEQRFDLGLGGHRGRDEGVAVALR